MNLIQLDKLLAKLAKIRSKDLTEAQRKAQSAIARKEFFEDLIDSRYENIFHVAKANIAFLEEYFGVKLTRRNISDYMGVEMTREMHEFFRGDNIVFKQLYTYQIIAVFFGVSVESLMFTDMRRNKDTIIKEIKSVIRPFQYDQILDK